MGMVYARIVDAGKGQMLAGGAIIFSYGVVASFFGLMLAMFVAAKAQRRLIIRLNRILAVLIIAFWTYFFIKYQQGKSTHDQEQNRKPSKTVTPDSKALLVYNFATHQTSKDEIKNSPGLGMFAPYLDELKPLYFYSGINFNKSILEHNPIDSITFKRNEYGGFAIATAPPWLLPDHLKLDYDLLYFNVQTVTDDFLEVVVNVQTQQTGFLDKRAGRFLYWPEFLLSVHSVEFLPDNDQKIYARPFTEAGTVSLKYSFMKPIKIRNNWMYVSLWNDNYVSIGNGWIRWRGDKKLLIRYSLLS